MAKVKQTVYLITEQQRDAIIGYLQNRPYREVASGIQFLMNAPTAVLNVDMPEDAQPLEMGEATGAEQQVEEPVAA
ncbi:MAG: hypothetical protein HC827_02990 [Cyanobacteria bacterium RM1_2_2]|nr:hypothetical protein [Cyanobacteria bacterium RM1_2_2]